MSRKFISNMMYGVNEQGRRVPDGPIFQLINPVFGCYASYGFLSDLKVMCYVSEDWILNSALASNLQ
jgi:hypothetical protein